MPQYDLYHDTVKNALIKDGWIITDDPFTIEFKGVYLYADLGAEKLLAAEKVQCKIVFEIKLFSSPSPMTIRARLQRAGSKDKCSLSLLKLSITFDLIKF